MGGAHEEDFGVLDSEEPKGVRLSLVTGGRNILKINTSVT